VIIANTGKGKKGNRKPQNGWIYCLVNPSFPDLVKIGLTTGSVEARMAQLDGTATPAPFQLVGKWRSRDVARDERRLHRALDKYRVRTNREFFSLDASEARHKISAILNKPAHAIRARRQRNGLAQALLFVLVMVSLIWLYESCDGPHKAEAGSWYRQTNYAPSIKQVCRLTRQ
ncbi:MAG: GIY-YIG nuclease family protein, partial [Pseudomonadota bacterium]